MFNTNEPTDYIDIALLIINLCILIVNFKTLQIITNE